MMLSIAHSAAQRWMVPGVPRIRRSRRLVRPNIDRGQSLSRRRQRPQPVQLLRRSRRVHRRQLPRVRQVDRRVREPKSMKTIRLESATRQRLSRRFRQPKNRTRHDSTKSLARCVSKWALCQNPPSENRSAVPTKSAWFRSSRRRNPAKTRPHANPRECPMMQLQPGKPPRSLNPPNGIPF